MDKIQILDFLIDIGKALLENGAEAYRVEDTICRILKSLNMPDSEAFTTNTGIFISICDNTKLKRVKNRNMNLGKIAKINDLSRKIVSKEISLLEAKEKLYILQLEKTYSLSTITFSVGATCFLFSLLFKGSIEDAINAFITGIFLNLFITFLDKRNVSGFLISILGGFIVSLISLINLNLGIGNNIDNIIMCSVIPLVPGVCFTNAIRDIFEGDYISGSSRLFESLVIAIGISTGVGIVLSGWLKVFDNFYIIGRL